MTDATPKIGRVKTSATTHAVIALLAGVGLLGCAGQNGCAGKGWVETSAEECAAKKGKVVN